MKSIVSSTPSLAITTVKLDGSGNYTSWIASVELWFIGQGFEDHLLKNSSNIGQADRPAWVKIDAQLCSLLWNSLDPKLLNLFQSCKTCCKVWNKAKTLYTNDIQLSNKIVSDIVHLQQNQQDMASYLGQVESLKDKFDSLMPSTDKLDDQETQRDRFFMVLALIGLRADLTSVRDQILSSPSVPTLEEVFARLLRITSTSPEVNSSDASIMAVQTNNFQGGYKQGKWRNNKHCTHCNKEGHVRQECRLLLFHCTHCNKGGHVREECRLLHGKPPRSNDRPPRTANVVHNGDGILPTPDVKDGSSHSITLTGADYNDYLQYQISKQQSSTSSTAYTVQPGNSFAYVAQSSSQEQWILDSGASDHISGNKNTLYSY